MQVGFNFHWNFQKVFALILVLICILAGGFFFLQEQIGPMANAGERIGITIPRGASVARIGHLLEEAGLVRQAIYFSTLSRMMGVDGKMQAGYYELNASMSVKEQIEAIVAGRVATYRLTIPEGLTVKEMAPLIETRAGIPAEEFLQAARDFRLDFVPERNVEFQVEGFLFPDTYHLAYNTTATELIQIMVNRFKALVSTQPVQVRGRTLTVWELVTIASLIEEEAKFDKDRPLVSGVIYNRLDRRMLLQFCSTVLYVLEEKKPRLSYADTRIDSPYNTYRYPGLPPGAISNPGLKSIQAALNPAEHQYLYFLSVPDGTTYYSRTLDEHSRLSRIHLD